MRKRLMTTSVLPLVLGLGACQTLDEGPHPKAVNADPAAWEDYLARSEHWAEVDRDFIQAEVEALGREEPTEPERTSRFGFDIHRPAAWYATEEGRRVADIIVSFQTPSGGWSKRTDMAHEPREVGQDFGVEPKYVPTFDNGATSTQMQVLARAREATGDAEYSEAFLDGVQLILEAQYPNGCWPQIYPLAGDYHDHITFNDGVMTNLLTLLRNVSKGEVFYAFVPPQVRADAKAALNRGLQCVLDTQVIVGGKPTIWAAQYDPFNMKPAWARAYEMPALATSESASLVRFLMSLEAPSEELVAAIKAAASWFDKHKIMGYRWDTRKRIGYEDPEAGPIWARFVEIGTGQPVFGDRDGSIHYDVMKVSEERRQGFAWYVNSGEKVLEEYRQWRERFPE